MARPIIFIKLNKFETMDGILDKFVIGDVIFIYFIDIVNVDHYWYCWNNFKLYTFH